MNEFEDRSLSLKLRYESRSSLLNFEDAYKVEVCRFIWNGSLQLMLKTED